MDVGRGHARLREHAERLGARVASLPAEAERLEWVGDLCLDLSQFIGLLLDHFEAEEQDGTLAEISERRPELAAEVRRLEQQHREMASLVADLRLVVDDARVRRFSSTLEELIERFQAHEAAENHLLADIRGEGER